MGVLQTVHRRHIRFNPANAEHRAAYWELRRSGRQHTELRFVLEDGFANVIAMMQAKIADHYSAPTPVEVVTLRKRERA